MQPGPGETGAAPAEMRGEHGAERPADGGGEAGEQRNPGDRPARGIAIEPGERRERRIIEAERHPDPEHRPGGEQRHRPTRQSQRAKPGDEHQIGGDQNPPATPRVDRPPDRRPAHRRDQERSGDGGEHHRRGGSGSLRHRLGEDRRQIIARRPGQGLGGAERENDLPGAAPRGLSRRQAPLPRRRQARTAGHRPSSRRPASAPPGPRRGDGKAG